MFITTDGAQQQQTLNPSPTSTGVSVAADSWGTATVVIQYSPDGVAWAPVREDGVEFTISSNWSGCIEGKGYVRAFSANASSATNLSMAVSGK